MTDCGGGISFIRLLTLKLLHGDYQTRIADNDGFGGVKTLDGVRRHSQNTRRSITQFKVSLDVFLQLWVLQRKRHEIFTVQSTLPGIISPQAGLMLNQKIISLRWMMRNLIL